MLKKLFNNIVISSFKTVGYIALGALAAAVIIFSFYLLPVIGIGLLGYSLVQGFKVNSVYDD